MKRKITFILSVIALTVMTNSCKDFLTEQPQSFFSPDNFFKNETEMQSAVDGLYVQGNTQYDYNNLASFFFVNSMNSPLVLTENMSGLCETTRASSGQDSGFILPLREENNTLYLLWKSHYASVENANSIIAGIEASKADVSAEKKAYFLGQAYFMRAYYYFHLVRLWGPIPYKTEPTTDLSSAEAELVSEAKIYEGIIADLKKAAELYSSQPWRTTDGRVSKGAIKALLAKVYLTAAGYPVQKKEYYAEAYNTAKEVIASGEFSLFESYDDLRSISKENSGEIVFSLQRSNADLQFYSMFHSWMLPFPYTTPISEKQDAGGNLVPTAYFVNSFGDSDLRKASFFMKNFNGVEFDRAYLAKYFDETALSDGLSGLDIPIIKYSDVLLTAAEAKAMADGGKTSDASAIDAFFKITSRACSITSKPANISAEDVLVERAKELCFEGHAWYDIIRTHKAYNPIVGKMVDAAGYQPTTLNRAYVESDFYFPYPLRDVRLNPNLKR